MPAGETQNCLRGRSSHISSFLFLYLQLMTLTVDDTFYCVTFFKHNISVQTIEYIEICNRFSSRALASNQ